MGTDIWIGMFDTPCEEEEREKEEVGEPAIKKREATKIEKKKWLSWGCYSEERPCPDEMDVVSLWQLHTQNKLFLWIQD